MHCVCHFYRKAIEQSDLLRQQLKSSTASVIGFPTSTVGFALTPVLCDGSFSLSGVILDFHHVTWGGELNSRLADITQRRSGNYLREVVV